MEWAESLAQTFTTKFTIMTLIQHSTDTQAVYKAAFEIVIKVAK